MPSTKPTLIAITHDPVDGDTLALHCFVSNDQVDAYQFYHDGKEIGLPQPNNVLNLAVSTQSEQNGDYQCRALIGDINSTLSDDFTISGRV